jgi:putative FmdB family regulatory protein
MPTYQYKCSKCGYEFEEFQKMTDAPVESCPKCKGKTRRIITGGAGFLFKGSGFYITDHRSDSYKESSRKEGGETGKAKPTETKKEKTKTGPKGGD